MQDKDIEYHTKLMILLDIMCFIIKGDDEHELVPAFNLIFDIVHELEKDEKI